MASIIETELVTRIGCSAMAAKELLKPAQAMAAHFVTVYDRFDLDHLILAARTIQRDIVHASATPRDREDAEFQHKVPEWEKHVAKVRRSLPRPVRNLLDSHEAACHEETLFCKALTLAKPTEIRFSPEALTATLETLHAQRQLSQPEKVGEGRTACQAIGRAGMEALNLPNGYF
jgi:hypothetical protein